MLVFSESRDTKKKMVDFNLTSEGFLISYTLIPDVASCMKFKKNGGGNGNRWV